MPTTNYAAKVTIGGAVSSSFTSAFGSAGSAVKKLGQDVKNLAATRKLIRQWGDSSADVKKLTSSLDVARVKAKAAREALAAAEKPTAALTAAVNRAEGKVKSLEAQLSRENTTLGSLTLKLNQAGLKTGDLAKHDAKLEAQLKRTTQALAAREKAQARLGESAGRFAKWGAATAAFGYGVAKILDPSFDASNEFGDMMVDVAKYVDGLDTDGKIKAFGNQIRDLGRDSTLGAKGIGELAIGAGKLGMAAPEALQFATAMDIMSQGLDLTATEASELLTKIKTGMNLTIPEVLKLGDAMNYLGDVTASDSKNIVSIIQRQGAVVKATTKMSNVQIAALASAFDVAAANPESGATAMKNFVKAMTVGKAATKGNLWAYGKLGLNAETTAQGMQSNPEQTILNVLRKVGQVKGADRGAVLSKLFGEESKGEIAQMVTGIDNLAATFEKVRKEENYLGRSEQERQRNLQKWGSQVLLFNNRMTDLKISVGDVVKDALAPLLSKTNEMLATFGKWRARNPELFASIVKVGLGVIALVGGLLALGTVVSGVIFAWSGLAAFWAALGTIAAAASLPVIGLIGTFALAAVVIGAVALAIYKYWQPISAFFQGVWAGISEGWQAAGGVELWNQIKEVVGFVAVKFMELIEPLKLSSSEFTHCFENGKTFGNWVGTALAGVLRMIIDPATAFKDIWIAIKDVFNSAFDSMKAKAEPFFEWITGKFEWVSGKMGAVKGWFGGGESSGKGPVLNPETSFNPPAMRGQSSTTVSNKQRYQIHVNAAPGQSEESIAQTVMLKLRQMDAAAARGSLYDSAYA